MSASQSDVIHPGAIGGRLFNEDGSPGTGIEISAQPLPMNTSDFGNEALSPPVVAQPDERGVFHINNLPFGNYAVQAQAEGRIARASCRLNRETPVADVLLVLQESAGIAGRVVDPAGAGVPGATIYPLLLDGKERQSSALLADVTLADGEGNFALPWLEAGVWTLQARAPGFAPTMSIPIATGTLDAVIQLEPGVPVSGRTVEGGAPAAEVKVTLATVGIDAPDLTVTSDVQGSFIFDAVGPGNYELRGAKVGQIVKNAPIQLAVANLPQEGLVLELVPGGVARGRVTDGDTGIGISGVTVKASFEGNNRLSQVSQPSDLEGRFEVTGLNTGAHEFFASEAPGYSRFGRGQSTVKATVTSGETLEDIAIVLSRGIVVTGHVVDTEGKPVGGAFVNGRVQGWQDQQTTGQDGAFTLSRLKGGELIRVLARTSSAISPEYVLDIPPAGLKDVDLVLELATDGLIAGVVVDRRSQPFHGRVSLALADEAAHRTTNRTNTDAEGRFLFANVAAGSYKIGASPADGVGRELLRLTMKPGQQVRDLRLVFDEEASLEISGKVSDESGAPVAANLRLERLEERSHIAQSMGTAVVDGTFKFQGLSEGMFSITASAPDYSNATVDDIASGSKDVSIVLSSRLSISGIVVSGENVPITDFEVAAIPAGAPVESSYFFLVPFKRVSDPEGAYSLSVDEGRYDVVARAPGFAMGRANAGPVTSEGVGGVDIVLWAQASVQGRIVDQAGQPVVGAAIFLGTLPNGAANLTDFAAARSGPEGQFEIGAPEADRGLHLSAFHRDAGAGEVVGDSNTSEPIEIQLQPVASETETEAAEREPN
ncbi:MAG: carboxypeptidase regulatory-like domain-containing protein [Candidatus Hydrogenedentes bacterium]|nr:carboxypeptidase regulatory-like domain-containing protein [Candidatus Hydrogenedentota bacterium]